MSSIQCPICGTIVHQISSATLELALWQHYNWSCERKKQYEKEKELPTKSGEGQ